MTVMSIFELVETKHQLADAINSLQPATEKKERCVSEIKIIWIFLSFLISVADVTVIIWLSYLHFSHSSDLVAWLMLLPILLNFIGIFTFLSNENERLEMEELGGKTWKNVMFFPVIGPAASTLRMFAYALQETSTEKAERLESLIMKMKQYESYFRAAPEAFIQITFRIITFSRNMKLASEDYWTSLCLLLCFFTLAETNMYGCVMPYYRLFEYSSSHSWNVDHISIPWRIGLFLLAFFAIGSRICADAIFKATFCFYFTNISFGEVIIICFLTQFILRASTYALFNGFGSSNMRHVRLAEQGVYGAFTYAWKSLFLSFDFQSYEKKVFLWFYFENLLMIGGSYAVIYVYRLDLHERPFYHIYAVSAVLGMVIAISLRFALRRRWKKKHSISSNQVQHVRTNSVISTVEPQ